MHSGRISVESGVGAGTRFVVSLPPDPRRRDRAAVPAPGGAAMAPAPANPESEPENVPSVTISSPAPLTSF